MASTQEILSCYRVHHSRFTSKRIVEQPKPLSSLKVGNLCAVNICQSTDKILTMHKQEDSYLHIFIR